MPNDRYGDRWVDRRKSAKARVISLPFFALAALAAACAGGFETPDLESGTIEGRLLNANAGAYVYPFGRPDLKVSVEDDGRFSVENVPAEMTELIVIDGPDPVDATRRAKRIWGIEVQGAERTELPDLDATEMLQAGTVLAAVQPAGGATADNVKFTVVGTDVEVVVTSGTAELAPLPAGLYEVTASMAGFQTGTTGTQVAPATTMETLVLLPVDQQAPQPGCAATDLCRNGLVCNPGDGLCHECVTNLDCQATHGYDSTCSADTCQPGLGTMTPRGICEPCANDGECASGSVCVTYGGNKFCSETYESFSCPAGFGRATDTGMVRSGDVCVPFNGCAAHRVAMGSTCFQDSTCSDLFLMASPAVSCEIPTTGAGYCTGSCLDDGDCIIPGWTCLGGGMIPGHCVPPP